MNSRLVRFAAAPLALLLSAAAVPADEAAADRVRGHVQFLASDELEGRATGSRGYAVAAQYVAAQFASLGLRPGGTGGGWYLQVPFRRATHVSPPQVRLRVRGRTTALAHGIDVSLQPSLLEKNRSIDAALVFVGHGLNEQALGLDDYAGLDVRGKIVVAFSGSPTGLPTEVRAHLDASKPEAAARRGALGLIEIPVEPTGAPRRFGSLGRPRLDWIDTAGKTGATSLLGARLAMTAKTAEQLFEGARTPLASLRAQAKSRRPVRGFAIPARLTINAQSSWHDFSSPEVIGLLPGSDPELAGEYVVLMGHLDHLGVKEDAKPGEDAIYNGALDNAAGIATMLEAAREFVQSGKRPRRSILFIANTGEEQGLLGADYFASHPTVPIKQIVAAVDLDMPLLTYDFTDVVAFGADHSTVARTVAQAARGMGIAVSPDPMPEQSIFVRSDHYQFVRRGVPAILLFTGYANGGKARWDHFFASVYHTPKDDLGQPINWKSGARYAKLNYEIARALADADARPRWYRGDYFGDRFAPGEPRAER
ncbi:M20/M25/M40 family metallo-hydrolase [Sphingomonas sp.]|uniref:M20/M25/M40 family metallo-hydrolase n=1 Tax=Sphingomonas sp. TaxID=28214 RepID=UPI001849D4E8|nr:M20/M25/M40 family metallo-hydrolase [Sphingomonas sp.]MBA3510640.1 M20/M25/M40 family metallo-hydrolase [Sphingomonas sp.]